MNKARQPHCVARIKNYYNFSELDRHTLSLVGTYEHFAETWYLMFCLKEEAASFSETLILPTNLHGFASQRGRNLYLIQIYTGIHSGLFSNTVTVNTSQEVKKNCAFNAGPESRGIETDGGSLIPHIMN
jgi:hypothetical protein